MTYPVGTQLRVDDPFRYYSALYNKEIILHCGNYSIARYHSAGDESYLILQRSLREYPMHTDALEGSLKARQIVVLSTPTTNTTQTDKARQEQQESLRKQYGPFIRFRTQDSTQDQYGIVQFGNEAGLYVLLDKSTRSRKYQGFAMEVFNDPTNSEILSKNKLASFQINIGFTDLPPEIQQKFPQEEASRSESVTSSSSSSSATQQGEPKMPG